MSREVSAAVFLAIVLVLILGVAVGQEIKSRRSSRGDNPGDSVIYEGLSANMCELEQEVVRELEVSEGSLVVSMAGTDAIEISLVEGRFSDEQIARMDAIVQPHHQARLRAEKKGIESGRNVRDVRRLRPPKAWLDSYQAAVSDSERLRVLAQYLGFEEPPENK